jgi:hypothetical protein
MCKTNEYLKGKLFERKGRKATGLSFRVKVAGLP